MIAEYENGNIARKFIYGPGLDEPVAMVDTTSETWYFYHYDGLGSVVALSKLNGSTVEVVERYKYDAFGQTTIYNEPKTQTYTESQFGNPYMFTGRRFDDETGLYYYRARMYSPKLGRFMQTDPIGYGDGMNMYAYCANNPINFIDPWGLCSEEMKTRYGDMTPEDEYFLILRIAAETYRTTKKPVLYKGYICYNQCHQHADRYQTALRAKRSFQHWYFNIINNRTNRGFTKYQFGSFNHAVLVVHPMGDDNQMGAFVIDGWLPTMEIGGEDQVMIYSLERYLEIFPVSPDTPGW